MMNRRASQERIGKRRDAMLIEKADGRPGQTAVIEATALEHVERSIRLLKLARDHLALAGARQAANAVRRALKSADGARRHAECRAMAEARR